MLLFFVVLVVCYADWKMTKHDIEAPFSGVACIPAVLRGDAMLPMQHRVLTPWIMGLLKGKRLKWDDYLPAYLYVKWLSILCAFYMCSWYFTGLGINVDLAICILGLWFVFSSLFEYHDTYWDMAFIAGGLAAIQGPYWFAVVLVFLGALNRETIIVVPVVSFFTADLVVTALTFGAFAAGYLLPRIVYGNPPRYCPLFCWHENLELFKEMRQHGTPVLINQYLHFALLVIATAWIYAVGPVTVTGWVLLSISALMLIPSIWREIRVFSPLMLSLIPMVIK